LEISELTAMILRKRNLGKMIIAGRKRHGEIFTRQTMD
jgi:hypothetical protein